MSGTVRWIRTAAPFAGALVNVTVPPGALVWFAFSETVYPLTCFTSFTRTSTCEADVVTGKVKVYATVTPLPVASA